MCVIILREPGIELPFDKIKTACKINPDGWGIAAANRGKLEIYREYKEGGNDPDQVMYALEKAKDLQVLLHLRYVTHGDKGQKNCHPFSALNYALDGTDIVFAHNGTLYDYKNPADGLSDSAHFNTQLVAPLLIRSAKLVGPENVLQDPFVSFLLEKECTPSSVFALLDGFNNVLIINEKLGMKFDGWWASNTYSFKDDHREPNYGGRSYYNSYSSSEYDSEWKSWIKNNDQTPVQIAFDSTSNIVPTVVESESPFKEFKDEDQDNIIDEAQQIRKTLTMLPLTSSPALIKYVLDKKRQTFCSLCEIDSLRELTRFDPDDIAEMVSFYPEASTLLILDLLHELYLKNQPTKATPYTIVVPVEKKEKEKEKETLNLPVVSVPQQTPLSEALN